MNGTSVTASDTSAPVSRAPSGAEVTDAPTTAHIVVAADPAFVRRASLASIDGVHISASLIQSHGGWSSPPQITSPLAAARTTGNSASAGSSGASSPAAPSRLTMPGRPGAGSSGGGTPTSTHGRSPSTTLQTAHPQPVKKSRFTVETAPPSPTDSPPTVAGGSGYQPMPVSASPAMSMSSGPPSAGILSSSFPSNAAHIHLPGYPPSSLYNRDGLLGPGQILPNAPSPPPLVAIPLSAQSSGAPGTGSAPQEIRRGRFSVTDRVDDSQSLAGVLSGTPPNPALARPPVGLSPGARIPPGTATVDRVEMLLQQNREQARALEDLLSSLLSSQSSGSTGNLAAPSGTGYSPTLSTGSSTLSGVLNPVPPGSGSPALSPALPPAEELSILRREVARLRGVVRQREQEAEFLRGEILRLGGNATSVASLKQG
ncbi:hypothetical protein M427DRAFT_248271 [Gonapodya prolifera JEL478]|uniref:Uncharacterized protein n=1 Tax=Gonapodya prolifera (strain JEL478) TaxID=1344416 RepID=A0A138ZXK8_GONPJ|nr:hypothetical protein M427DRAFT_248271 [Gonapodya prolifera JEL478]|eukprot:KXS09214.1 hypothetical protein M427DRAFT_248271 [Gonapodya prolifera JEL478]